MKQQNELFKLEIVRGFEIAQRDIENLLNLVYSSLDSKESLKQMYQDAKIKQLEKTKGFEKESVIDNFDLIYSNNLRMERKFDLLEREGDRIRRLFKVPVQPFAIESEEMLNLVLENIILLQSELLSVNVSDLKLKINEYYKKVNSQESREFKLKIIELIDFLTKTCTRELISPLFIVSQSNQNKNYRYRDFRDSVLNPVV